MIICHDQLEFTPGVQGWCNTHKSIDVIHYSNRMKDKNHIIFSIDVEKAFDKIQHPLMIETQQTGYSGNVLKHNKVHI